MLKIDTNKPLPDCFLLTEKEEQRICELTSKLALEKKESSMGWAIQRFWLDETLSDTEKVYLIFMLGRFYQLTQLLKGGL